MNNIDGPYRASAEVPMIEDPITNKSFELPLPIKVLGGVLGKILITILGISIICAALAGVYAAGWVLFVEVHRFGLYLGINLYHIWLPEISAAEIDHLIPVPWLVGASSFLVPALISFFGYALGNEIKNIFSNNE